jgi:hypothetical protein
MMAATRNFRNKVSIEKGFVKKRINITDNDNPLDSKFIKKMNALDQEDIFDTIKEYRENRYKRASTLIHTVMAG